jgi:hypothetical protein
MAGRNDYTRDAVDAWDIVYCIRGFPGGLDALVREFQPHMGHGLVKEGLRKIADKFATPGHTGPLSVADFEGVVGAEARALAQRDAFERVSCGKLHVLQTARG